MKNKVLCGAAVIAFGLSAAPSYALTIDFATGQNPSGTISTTGDTQDVNWTATNANTYKDDPHTFVVSPTNADWYGGWFANGPGSSWIAPNPDSSNNGNFTLTYSFDLTGYNLASAVFAGTQWSIDDSGFVALNGHVLDTQGNGQWGNFHSFTAALADLLPGVNTLTMTVTSSDDFLEAARLEGTLTVSQTPIPAALPLFASALAGIGFLGWRRRKNAT
jgi:hypothetical protein